MRRRRILLWGLGLAVLVPALAVVLLFVFSDALARWALERVIAGEGEVQVHLDGEVTLALGSTPRLTVKDLWVANPDWVGQETLARLGEAEVRVALLPLLSGTVLIRRLALADFTLNLETAEDGRRNWEAFAGKAETREPQEFGFAPIFESLSIANVAINIIDRRDGETLSIALESLSQEQPAPDQNITIAGRGSVNGTDFQIDGQGQPLETALAAKTPYPFRLDLQGDWLSVTAVGSVRDLPAGEGFDVDVTAETPDIAETLAALKIRGLSRGRTTASAKLAGNLGALAVEDILVDLTVAPAKGLSASGRLAHLESGQGLDIAITGVLVPDTLRSLANLPPDQADLLQGIEDLEIAGHLTGDIGAPRLDNVSLSLRNEAGAALTIAGGAVLNFEPRASRLDSLDAKVTLSLPDQAGVAQAFQLDLPELGPLTASSRVTLEDAAFHVRDLEAAIPTFGNLKLTAEGRLASFDGQDLPLAWAPNLALSLSLQEPNRLLLLFPAPPEPPRAAPTDRRRLVRETQEGLKALGFDPGPLDGLTGPRTSAAIEAFERAYDLPSSGLVSAELFDEIEKRRDRRTDDPTLSAIRTILARLGPGVASGQLSGTAEGYRIENLELSLGERRRGQLSGLVSGRGSLGTLAPGADPALAELDLAVTLDLSSSRLLEPLLDKELPEFKQISGNLRLTGDQTRLAISAIDLRAQAPAAMAVTARGNLAALPLSGDRPLSGLRIALTARAAETASLFELVDIPFADFGPLSASAQISDQGRRLTLGEGRLSVGSGDPNSLTMTASVGDLLSLKRVKLAGTFEADAAAVVKAQTQSKRLGVLFARFELSDDNGTFGIDRLEGGVKQTELLKLTAKGALDDLPNRNGLDFQLSASIPNLAALAAEFGAEGAPSRPLSFDGRMAGADEGFNFDGDMTLGRSKLTGKLAGLLQANRPVLSANLTSEAFYLDDLGLEPKSTPLDGKAGQDTDDPRQIFSDAPIDFAGLRDFDLNLRIALARIRGVEIDIQQVHSTLDLKRGVLSVKPFDLEFVGGKVAASLLLDAAAPAPKLHLKLLGDNADLGRLLAQARVEVPLSGKLDMQADITGGGESARQIASSLGGQVDFAVAEGRVLTSLLELTGVNIWSWMLSKSRRRGYSKLNCLIGHFKLNEGVADTSELLIDTKNVQVFGAGNIDLARESINLHFEPRSKRSRLFDSFTPFALTGPLASPNITVGSGVARRVLTDTLVSPINMLGSLLPIVNDGGRNHDNPCLETLATMPHP